MKWKCQKSIDLWYQSSLCLCFCLPRGSDHAGWTPLHEACNHGSTACVEALLRHRPCPVLTSQVGGVSPLHDALINGHTDIAKMLLEFAGEYTNLVTRNDQSKLVLLDLNPFNSMNIVFKAFKLFVLDAIVFLHFTMYLRRWSIVLSAF